MITDGAMLAAHAGIADTLGGRLVRAARFEEREPSLGRTTMKPTMEQLQERAARLRERLQRTEQEIITRRLNAITRDRLRADLQAPATSVAR